MPRAAVVVLSTALALAALPALPSGANAAEPGYGEVLNILPPGQSGTVTAADAAKVAAGDPQGRVAIDGKNAPTQLREPARDVRRAQHGRPWLTQGGRPDEVLQAGRPSTCRPTRCCARTTRAPVYTSRGTPSAFRTSRATPGRTSRSVPGTPAPTTGCSCRTCCGTPVRARAAEFLGPTDDNVKMDQEQLRSAYYTHDEAAAQVAALPGRFGAEGTRMVAAVDAFLAGINAGQDAMCPLGSPVGPQCPAEYAALGKKRRAVGPRRPRLRRLAGRRHLRQGRWRRVRPTHAGCSGCSASSARRPAARSTPTCASATTARRPTTATTMFPYGGPPRHPPRPPRRRAARPERRRPHPAPARTPGRDADRRCPRHRRPADSRRPDGEGASRQPVLNLPFGDLDLSLRRPRPEQRPARRRRPHPPPATRSPCSARRPATTRRSCSPSRCWRARASRRAASPSPARSFVVQLGRGVDYAWSATSASNDNVDTVVERLCSTDGTQATVRSTLYRVDGKCVPMDRCHEETALPNLGATEPPRQIRLEVLRTRHGIVQLRTTVRGRPVAIVTQRSTYHHEVDSVVGFARLNDPAQTHDAASFQRSASAIDYTFNWFYTDSRDISYYSSGLLPRRAKGTDFDLPRWGDRRYDWKGWLPFGRHVHQTNPPTGFLASWNNKPAPALVCRRQRLGLRRGLSRAQLVGMVADAATVDSRAKYTLPMLLKVIGKDPRAADTRAAEGVAEGGRSPPRPRPRRCLRAPAGHRRLRRVVGVADHVNTQCEVGREGRVAPSARLARWQAAEGSRQPPAQWPWLSLERGCLVRLREQGPARAARSTCDVALLAGLLRPRLAGSLPDCPACLAGGSRRPDTRGAEPDLGRPPDLRQAPGRHPARDRRPGRRPADRLAEPADVPAGRGLP